LNDLRDAVFAAKMVSYAQGYTLLREAANTFKWKLNYGGIALMWRGGCIIRSKFLGKVRPLAPETSLFLWFFSDFLCF
jgi:6-phosphogluconate dehydrogenase